MDTTKTTDVRELEEQYSNLLTHPDGQERLIGLRALAKLKAVNRINEIGDLLKIEETDAVRGEAIQTLAKLKDSAVLKTVLPLFKDEQNFTRESICFAIGVLSLEDGIPILIDAMKNDDETKVRATAALAFRWFKGSVGCKELEDFLQIEESSLGRMNAITALVHKRCSTGDTLGLLAKYAKEDDDESVRDNAVWGIGLFEAKEHSELLLDVLYEDEDENVRRNAAWALLKVGSEDIIEELESFLDEEESFLVKKQIEDTINFWKKKKTST